MKLCFLLSFDPYLATWTPPAKGEKLGAVVLRCPSGEVFEDRAGCLELAREKAGAMAEKYAMKLQTNLWTYGYAMDAPPMPTRITQVQETRRYRIVRDEEPTSRGKR